MCQPCNSLGETNDSDAFLPFALAPRIRVARFLKIYQILTKTPIILLKLTTAKILFSSIMNLESFNASTLSEKYQIQWEIYQFWPMWYEIYGKIVTLAGMLPKNPVENYGNPMAPRLLPSSSSSYRDIGPSFDISLILLFVLPSPIRQRCLKQIRSLYTKLRKSISPRALTEKLWSPKMPH